jgi:hypothetical protein
MVFVQIISQIKSQTFILRMQLNKNGLYYRESPLSFEVDGRNFLRMNEEVWRSNANLKVQASSDKLHN